MTLKQFVICSLPSGAVKAIVPGGEVNNENKQTKNVEINISFNKEKEGMEK